VPGGEQLGDHWLLGKIGYFDESFRIPLIVRDPRAEADVTRGRTLQAFTESIDVMPTILDWLGAEVPRAAFGDQGRDLSGAALELELQPLVHKVERKRRSWERALRQRAWRVLDLLERFGGADLGGARGVEVVWGPVLPVDEERAARVQVALVGAGIRSRLTAARELGSLDPAAELAQVAREQAVATPAG
jgi:hypothetical protein